MVEGQTLILTPAELFSEGLVEDPYPTYHVEATRERSGS